MDDNTVVSVEHVSKKFCRLLRRSMTYGVRDIARNMLGLSARSQLLREQEFWAVDDVSFDVVSGETLGIIGPNGSGKSTLLKMINGIFWPDKGKITVRGKVGALIEAGAGFHPMLTGRENVYVNAAILGMTRQETKEKFNAIVEFADIGDFIDTPVKHYSTGMFVRLGFSVAIHCEPDILLIDEVLAVGDEGFQKKCYDRIGELRESGVTTILVSHNMHKVLAFTDRIVLTRMGKATYFDDVARGVAAYNRLFVDKEEGSIKEYCNGNDYITFFDVDINKRTLHPNDLFSIAMKYTSAIDYDDVEMDILIYNDQNMLGRYFDVTNKAYNKKLDLHQGTHDLKITIESIPITGAAATVSLGIWDKKHTQQLFWWKIPIEFTNIDHSAGYNFLNVHFDT